MILVTGSTGFVGKHLIKRLENVFLYKRGQSLQGLKPDIIFNLAGEIYDETKMFASNVQLVHDLLQLPFKKFIHICSSSVYGRKNYPIKETDSLNPQTLYEITKAAGSLLCMERAIIARPFSLYGPNDNSRKFFPTILRERVIEVFSGSHDWIYIDDFIDGLIMLSEVGEPGIVNFGTGICTSNLEVVKTFAKFLDIKYNINNSYIKSYDSENWVCDPTYAKERYGFTCKYTLEAGIKKLISEDY